MFQESQFLSPSTTSYCKKRYICKVVLSKRRPLIDNTNLRTMKRIFSILFFSIVAIAMISCSSENVKIKKALKSSIPVESIRNYKYKSHQIIETLLKSNVEDSIATYESANRVTEMSIERKNQMRDSYQTNLDDCRRQQRNTLYWLRSSYDGLIRDWQRMLDDVNEEIAEDSLKIKANNEKIEFFRHHLENTDSPIIFYVVRHEYQLSGAYRREDVTLDANYQLIKQ